MDLTGHHVFVTGGGSGIGLALAREFVAMGNVVTVCGRTVEKLVRAAEAVPGLRTMHWDLTDEARFEEKAARMEIADPPVSILVNNAAIGFGYDLARDPQAMAKAVAEIHTNLMAPIKLTIRLLPDLLRRERAAIVNVTSGLAVCPAQAVPGYSAAKAGLRAFTRALRAQLAGSRVWVFEALPPLVDTELVNAAAARKMSGENCARRILRDMARGRTEIPIGLVRWLCVGERLSPRLADAVLLRYLLPFSSMKTPQ